MLKDQIVEYLAHRSDFGWNVLTALMLLVTLLYLITLGIEFFRKEKLDEALSQVTLARDELKNEANARAVRTTLYSNVLRDILLADFDVDSSIRAFEGKQYLVADKAVTRGIARLEATLGTLSGQSLEQRMHNFSYDPSTCAMQANNLAANNKTLVPDSSLIPAVNDRLAIAYRARIFQHYTQQPRPKGWEQSIRRDAYAASTLDPHALGIFHWLGIAETAAGDVEHAETCYEMSIHQAEPHGVDDLVSVDYINLAELKFFKGRCCYGQVEHFARTFLDSDRDTESKVDIARTTVANFYLAAARYLQSSDPADPRSTALKTFCKDFKTKNGDLMKRFSSKELDEYISRPPRPEDISKDQLIEINIAIDCVLSDKRDKNL